MDYNMDYESIKKKYSAQVKGRRNKIALAKAKVEAYEAYCKEKSDELAKMRAEYHNWPVREYNIKYREVTAEMQRANKVLSEAKEDLAFVSGDGSVSETFENLL